MKKFKEKQKVKGKLYLMLFFLISLSVFFVLKKISEKKVSNNANKILSYVIYCNESNWRPPHQDSIFSYIERFKDLDTYTWHHCYGHFGSGVRGELIYKDSCYNYNLNAGGWLTLEINSSIKILGSMDKNDTINNFISVYYCDENWD